MFYSDIKFIHLDKDGNVQSEIVKHTEFEAHYQQVLDDEGEVIWYGSKPYPADFD